MFIVLSRNNLLKDFKIKRYLIRIVTYRIIIFLIQFLNERSSSQILFFTHNITTNVKLKMSFIQTLIDQNFTNFDDSVFEGKFDFYNQIMKLFQEGSSDKAFAEKLSTDLKNAFDNSQNKEQFFEIFQDLFKKVISTNIGKLQQQSIRSAFQKHFGQEIVKEEKKEEIIPKKVRKERKDKGVADYQKRQDNRYFFQTKAILTIKTSERLPCGQKIPRIIKVTQILNVGVLKSLCDENGDIQNELLANFLFQCFAKGASDKNIVVKNVDINTYIFNSEDEIIKLFVESKIIVDPNADLMLIPMKQHFKLLKQFGNTKILNPNEGQCVIDYLVNRYGNSDKRDKNNFIIAFKDKNLKIIFGENYKTNGINTEQLSGYCEEYQIDIYAFNVFDTLIYKKTYGKTTKPAMFYLKNGHLFLIVDTSLIKSIVQTGRGKMMDYKFSIIYDNFQYFDQEPIREVLEMIKKFIEETKIDDQKEKFNAKVVLLNNQNYDINIFCHEEQIMSEYQITDFKFDKDNHLLAFRIPCTNLVIETVSNFAQRREDFLHLKRLLPNIFNQFQNQSYCEMGIQMFEMLNLMNKLRSNMYDKLFEFYQDYPRGPYLSTIPFDQKEIDRCCDKTGLDINKSYSNVILNSGYDYNQYNVFDEIVEYDGRQIFQGSYFLSKGITIEKIKAYLPPGLFEYPIVQWALKNKFVEKEDITHMIIPQKMIDCKIFERIILTTIATQESDQTESFDFIYLEGKPCAITQNKKYGFAKHIINNFIGCLAKSHNKKVKGTMLNNHQEACALFNQVIKEGNISSIYQHQNIFFVTQTSKTPQLKNSIPVYRQIIELGMMQLFQLALDSCKEDSKIISYNTDYVSILRPKKINLEEYSVNDNLYEKQEIDLDFLENFMQKYGKINLDQIGRIKKEEFKIKGQMKEQSEQIIPEISLKQFNVIEESEDITETVRELSKISCLGNCDQGLVKAIYVLNLLNFQEMKSIRLYVLQMLLVIICENKVLKMFKHQIHSLINIQKRENQNNLSHIQSLMKFIWQIVII